mmetsp:Transcript_45205/g.113798  ORF Transcript_45205/g.113798 Transcript_45205/m.113798 type:complete len:194 (-) Transcript_45205:418-999(-)
MFSLTCGLWSHMFSRLEYNLLVLGINGAGKTTLLERIKSTFSSGLSFRPDRIQPTVGLNIGRVDCRGVRLVLRDLGGAESLRTIWTRYFSDAHAVVFVVDVADSSRLPEAKACIEGLVAGARMAHKPFILLGNKADLPGALSVAEVNSYFDLTHFTQYYTACASALSGDGVCEVLERIVDILLRSEPSPHGAT